jgi:hypothetical protein
MEGLSIKMFCRPAQAIRMVYQDKLLSRSFLFRAEAGQVLYIHIPYSFVARKVRVPHYMIRLRNVKYRVVLDFRF